MRMMKPVSKLSYMGEPHENVWATGKAARGQGKESLQQPPINVHLYMYFAQTKGKMMFQKSELIDNRPNSWEMYVCYVNDRWTHFEKEDWQRQKIAFSFCER